MARVSMTLKEGAQFLGLSTSFTAEEAKTAYRRLSIKYHPDKGGNEEDFKKLVEAYRACKNGGTYDFQGYKSNARTNTDTNGPTSQKVKPGYTSYKAANGRNSSDDLVEEFMRSVFGKDFVREYPNDPKPSRKNTASYNVFEWFKNNLKHTDKSNEGLSNKTAAELYGMMNATMQEYKDALNSRDKDKILQKSFLLGLLSMRIAQRVREKL